jgi:hypothetical protein
LDRSQISQGFGLSKISILGDSMMVIRYIIKRQTLDNNVITGIIFHSIALLKEFKEHSIHHIKQEHNSQADRWAKEGTLLEEGLANINEAKRVIPPP